MKANLRRPLSTAFLVIVAAMADASALAVEPVWVSSGGSDAGPCTRVAPCATLARAVAVQEAYGQVLVVDPGSYGPVTITKPVTIDGGQAGGFATIVNGPGMAGITISVSAPDGIVTLRNLSIDGRSGGTVGIRIAAASKVYIEDCEISGQRGSDPSGRGVSDERGLAGQLVIVNTMVRNNEQSGVVVQGPTNWTFVEASLHRVRMLGNGLAGIALSKGALVSITSSVMSGNRGMGLYAEQPLGLGATSVFITDSVASNNSTGVHLGPGQPVVRLSNTVITQNDAAVVNVDAGLLYSHGNNKIGGNQAGNTPAMIVIGTQ